jgi:hypothetical protein
VKDYERTLPKPATPRLVENGWQTIQLRFNTSELEGYSNLRYILEVKPHWGPQDRNLFVMFPYTRKYHYVSRFLFLTHPKRIVIKEWTCTRPSIS